MLRFGLCSGLPHEAPGCRYRCGSWDLAPDTARKFTSWTLEAREGLTRGKTRRRLTSSVRVKSPPHPGKVDPLDRSTGCTAVYGRAG